MTLIETVISMGIGVIVIAGMAGFIYFDSLSKATLYNYVELNSKSMTALDKMTSELREMIGVSQMNASGTYIVFTNASTNRIAFSYNSGTQKLLRQNLSTGEPEETLLEDCYEANFQLFKPTPPAFGSTNFSGSLITNLSEARLAKLVLLSWSCERVVESVGRRNTESVQTAKIVLRN